MPSPRQTRDNPRAITPRESEVLHALGLRMSTVEIARLLNISPRTVESHVSSLLLKFDVHDRRQLLDVAGGRGRDSSRSATPKTATMPNPVMVAELDRSAVIVSVNPSWVRFCVDNGGDPKLCGPGVSYLHVCAVAGDTDSNVVASHIRSATRGGVFVPLLARIPCNSPTRHRQYDVLVSSRVDDEGVCVGAIVSLSEYVRPN